MHVTGASGSILGLCLGVFRGCMGLGLDDERSPALFSIPQRFQYFCFHLSAGQSMMTV